MTKPKRVTLLVVDIVTVLSGLATLLVAIVFVIFRNELLPNTPSHQEIYAASTERLRTYIQLMSDRAELLSNTVQDFGALLVLGGVVMFVGSILRLVATPWRLSKTEK